ncbi:TerB N-terminal domain-containing protein [Paenibacillus thalictri]|uniref:NINE protein n=1 Tax=Paenibacillus thalictri TaxID=2527873 RepID=A0A4Q9DLW8_9BACL|nr:TerB N-terminal domain-containing protein [Paenibacillus thalictri]TBL76132.1 NINE protein [Paenibacillus thalictri]
MYQVPKNISTALILCLLLGSFGAHHFYLRRYKLAILYLLFFWTYVPLIISLIELFFIPSRVRQFNLENSNSNFTKEEVNIKMTKPAVRIKENNKHPQQRCLPDGGYNLKDFPIDILSGKRKAQIHSRGGLEFEITHSGHFDRFYEQSCKYRNHTVKSAAFEPFHTYWPTFESMSKYQQQWYFYWREQVVNGNYPDTDLSYIFLFTYELMAYSFEPNPNKSVALLIRMYEANQERYPKLNTYLPEWIGDLFYEGGRKDLAEEWYSRSSIRSASHAGQYEAFDRFNAAEMFAKIPFRLWKKQFIYYRTNQFNEEHAQLLTRAYKKAFDETNLYYLESSGKTLIDHWFPKQKSESAHLFRSAVIISTRSAAVKHVIRRGPTSQTHHELNALIRFVENLVRANQGIKRKIKVDEGMIPEALQKRLEQRFSLVQKSTLGTNPTIIPPELTANHAEPFELNTGLIAQLKLDSEAIQSALQVEDVETLVHQEAAVSTQNVEQDKPLHETDNENPLASLGSGASQEVASFAMHLTDHEREFLTMFTDEIESIESCTAFAKKRGMMLNTLINTINEKAVEHLGDVLLEEDGDNYIVVVDFIDIIDEVIN